MDFAYEAEMINFGIYQSNREREWTEGMIRVGKVEETWELG
jgi:hypothetical protein